MKHKAVIIRIRNMQAYMNLHKAINIACALESAQLKNVDGGESSMHGSS